MTKAFFKKINNILKHRENIFKSLSAFIIILSLIYTYFLYIAIVSVIERDKIVKENKTVLTSISEIESVYFSLKNTVTIDLAHAKGFKDSEVTSFISKKPITAMVSHEEF